MLKVDLREVQSLSDALSRISADDLFAAAATAVNEVASRSDVRLQGAIVDRINLSAAYVGSKIRLAKAEPAQTVRAEIIASDDLTIMGRYGAEQLRIAGTRTRRGTSVGRRPSGVDVEIRRGTRIREVQWFVLPLKGTGGKTGVFVRKTSAGGKPVHLYGPSPYSLLRQQGQYKAGELLEDLERTATATVLRTLEGIL